MFYACELIYLYSVVLCVVIAVYRFDLGLVINDRWKEGHAVIKTHVFDRVDTFLTLPSSLVLRDGT